MSGQSTYAPRGRNWKTPSRGADLPQVPGELDRLGGVLRPFKREFITLYIDLHTRARLGVNDDKRKGALLADPRLQTLQKLVGIELMPLSN